MSSPATPWGRESGHRDLGIHQTRRAVHDAHHGAILVGPVGGQGDAPDIVERASSGRHVNAFTGRALYAATDGAKEFTTKPWRQRASKSKRRLSASSNWVKHVGAERDALQRLDAGTLDSLQLIDDAGATRVQGAFASWRSLAASPGSSATSVPIVWTDGFVARHTRGKRRQSAGAVRTVVRRAMRRARRGSVTRDAGGSPA
jgi:hypothetical protein